MKQYNDAIEFILKKGKIREDRTGEGTISVFGYQMRFDLTEGFPAVTTKKLAWKSVISELLFFIEGSGDERRLREILHGDRNSPKTTIWTANAEAPYWKPKAKFEGDLGRVYGVQWRSWHGVSRTIENTVNQLEHLVVNAKNYPNQDFINELSVLVEEIKTNQHRTVDQLANLIHGLKTDPYGRRHILTAWNPTELDQMALPPCHTFSQFYVQDGKLSCQMYQRSADFFLGVPFNIASYAAFTHMIAQVCDLEVGEFIHTFGDAHIYLNHLDAVKEQLSRQPFELPKLQLNPLVKNIEDFTMNDFQLIDYKHHDPIKAKMAV